MIGIDIFDIRRVEKLMKHQSFINRFFTDNEIKYLEEKNFKHNTIGGLISAKEAVLKAFKIGFTNGLSFKDVEILHDKNNSPYVNIENTKIKKLMFKMKIYNIVLNISHDGDYATAIASLENSIKVKDINVSIPKRNTNANKYDFGKILIIGGSKGMTGSVVLSSEAALRSGAGLVYLLVPECIRDIVEMKTKEQIVVSLDDDGKNEFGKFNKEDLLNIIQNKTVVAIGPGMGVNQYARDILEIVLKNFAGPIVIDADAINILALYPEWIRENVYITPHVVEFSRLSNYTVNEIEYDRQGCIKNFLDKYDISIILKGHNSIVADKYNLFVNHTGNSGMATAGSGDVLTGIVAALLARENTFNMFKFSCYIHGLAGDLAALEYGENGLIARDLIQYLPKAFGEVYED